MAKKNKIDRQKLIQYFRDQEEQKKKKQEAENASRFNSFLDDSYKFLNTETERYNKADYNTTNKSYKEFSNLSESWKNKSKQERSYLDSVKDSMSSDQYDTLLSYLNQFDTAVSDLESGYSGKRKYYSNFDTEDAARLYSMTLDELKNERKEVEKSNFEKPSELADNWFEKFFASFVDYSASLEKKSAIKEIDSYIQIKEKQKKDAETKEKALQMTQDALNNWRFPALSSYETLPEGKENALYDIINGKGDDIYSADDKLNGALGSVAMANMYSGTDVVNRYEFEKNKAAEMSDDEKKAYTYYVNAENKGIVPEGTAASYLEAIELNKKATETRAEDIAAKSAEDPFGYGVANILLSPMKIPSTLEDVASVFTSKEIDPYDYNHSLSQTSQAVNEGATRNMSDVGAFFYNTGMSMLNTGYNIALGGGTAATTFLMGIGAANDAILSAKERGATDQQAILTGVLAGAFEAVFEKVSLESLLTPSGKAGALNAIKDLLKQSFTEASEETLTEISNIVADSIINGDLSVISTSIQNNLANGMSYENAVRKASGDAAMQVLEATAGGFLSGAGFGTAKVVSNAAQNRAVGNALIDIGMAEETATLAAQFEEGSATRDRYEEYAKKLADTGKANPSYVGAMQRTMEMDSAAALSDASYKSAVEFVAAQLEEKGVSVTDKLAEAVVETVYNKKSLPGWAKAELKTSGALDFVNQLQNDTLNKNRAFRSETIDKAEQQAEKVSELNQKAAKRIENQTNAKNYNIESDGAGISSLAVADNGDVMVRSSDGNTSPATEAKVDTTTATAMAYAEDMSPAMKKTFFEDYEEFSGRLGIDEYHDGFSLAYKGGLNAVRFSDVVNATKSIMSENETLKIYNQGLEARRTVAKQGTDEIKGIQKELGIENRTPGTVDDSLIRYQKLSVNDRRRAIVGVARIIAASTGRNVVLFDSTKKQRAQGVSNGYYNPANNTVYVDINAGISEAAGAFEDSVLTTLSHELVHNFKKEDSAGFAILSDLVFDVLQKSENKTKAQLVEAEVNRILESDQKRFEGVSEKTRNEIAEEEIVARACEDRLANSRLMKEFVDKMDQKDSSLTQRFSNMLGVAIRKLKALFQKLISSYQSNSKEAVALRQMTENLEAIQAQFDALLERKNNANTAEIESSQESSQQKNTPNDRGVMMRERYENAIDLLNMGSLDRKLNSHLKLLDHTPSIYLEKADAKDLKIIIAWDVAYLAMKKSGDIPGNYHGLGSDVMKMIPNAIKNPLYIVKQKNGRIAAITEIKVKGKRAVFVSLELDTFKSTTQEGSDQSENYNLIVTILDAKPNYLKNTIFKGDIVYNKNKEDPANFILRLKSLNKALPNDDLAKSSVDSIPDSIQSVKEKQLEIINKTNPAPNTFQTWIRKVDDIRTWDEVLGLDDESEGQFVWGDFSRADAEQALKDGTITVYSSNPIKNGVFVSTSLIQAQEYAGGKNGKVYSKLVPLSNVAWINGDEGQYAQYDGSGSAPVMKQERNPYQSARDILLAYAKDARNIDAQSEYLAEYTNRVKALDEKLVRLEAAESKLAAAVDSGNEKDAEFFKKRMETLEKNIRTLQSDLTAMENSKQLKAIVRREKAETRAQGKIESRENLESFKDYQERKNRISRIEGKVDLLANRILKNNKENHIPDSLKETVSKFITAIDFTKTRKLHGKTVETKNSLYFKKLLDDVGETLRKSNLNSLEGNTEELVRLDVDPEVIEKIKELSKQIEEFLMEQNSFVLSDLATEQLRDLDFVLTGITRALNNIDKAFGYQNKKSLSELSENSIAFMRSKKPKADSGQSAASGVKRLLTWKTYTPYTAFSRFGDGGKEIYNGLVKGWGEYAFRAREILDFSEETFGKKSKEWSEEVLHVELNGEEFYITKSQLMSFYLTSKREQGIRHLDEAGFKVDKIKVKGHDYNETDTPIKSTQEQRESFFDRYLPEGSEERTVADKIQQFMTEKCAAWGNEVSLVRWGYRAFTEEHYFPLYSDKEMFDTGAPEATNFNPWRILNLGFTKSLNLLAGNAVLMIDVFDVFAIHAADMAKYSTMGLPILNAIRWLNYKIPVFDDDGNQIRSDESMRTVMKSTYGPDAFGYVQKFLSDLNGASKNEMEYAENIYAKWLSAGRRASVGFNLKTVCLQPTSYFRALNVISAKSLTKAVALIAKEKATGVLSSEKAEKYYKLAEKYCGMAAWKGLGYFNIDISKSLATQIKHSESMKDKLIDASMYLAGQADKYTLGALFKACQLELVENGQTEGLSQEEIWKKAGEMLDEVIVRTQVVDSTITRSQAMRHNGLFLKSAMAFLSEPTVSYNMLAESFLELSDKRKQGEPMRNLLKGKSGKNFGRVLLTHGITQLASSIVEAIWENIREDDEEDETEDEAWLDFTKDVLLNFVVNLNPFSSVVVVKDVIKAVQDFSKGWTVSLGNLEIAAFRSIPKALKKTWKLLTKEEASTPESIYDAFVAIAAAFSDVSGIGASNALRDLTAIWNETFGEAFDMKIG